MLLIRVHRCCNTQTLSPNPSCLYIVQYSIQTLLYSINCPEASFIKQPAVICSCLLMAPCVINEVRVDYKSMHIQHYIVRKCPIAHLIINLPLCLVPETGV